MEEKNKQPDNQTPPPEKITGGESADIKDPEALEASQKRKTKKGLGRVICVQGPVVDIQL